MVLENGEICMKKIAAAAIAAIMSVSSAFCCPQTISEAAVPQIISIEDNTVQESGKCGNSAYWSLDGGKLSITGTGNLVDWLSSDKVPWSSYRSRISSVDIASGITSIGSYAFMNCSSLSSVNIPNTVTELGLSAFNSCSSLGSRV